MYIVSSGRRNSKEEGGAISSFGCNGQSFADIDLDPWKVETYLA